MSSLRAYGSFSLNRSTGTKGVASKSPDAALSLIARSGTHQKGLTRRIVQPRGIAKIASPCRSLNSKPNSLFGRRSGNCDSLIGAWNSLLRSPGNSTKKPRYHVEFSLLRGSWMCRKSRNSLHFPGYQGIYRWRLVRGRLRHPPASQSKTRYLRRRGHSQVRLLTRLERWPRRSVAE